MIFLHIIAATTVVGLISFSGVLFFLAKENNHHRLTFYFVSLASGTMLGNAFMNLIPEAMDQNHDNALIMIALGIFIFFILEQFLIWRHCHSHEHSTDHQKPIAARMVIIGDAVHNFIDGAMIASAFLIDARVGMAVTTAIILHEIPQEMGDFGILIRGGYSVKRALIVNAWTATTALIGATATYVFLETAPLAQTFLVPIIAGGFLYIPLADLIPQLHEKVALKQMLIQIALLLGGFGLMTMFRHGHG